MLLFFVLFFKQKAAYEMRISDWSSNVCSSDLNWVLGMDLTPVQFLILAQIVIFLLGWPLEWTEIIVIFMPIFLPLLAHYQIDPLFFGLLVALNQIGRASCRA